MRLLILSEKMVAMAFSCSQDLKNLPILLLFADDVVLVSSTQPGLQSQMPE